MSNDSKHHIREYLLGRITDSDTLEKIEERLFADGPFCSEVEVVEEELVHDYVFGKLSGEDRKSFEEKIVDNSGLKFQIEMATALKEKALSEAAETAGTPVVVEGAGVVVPGFLASIRDFFRQPAYVGAFAVLLIGVLIVGYLLLPQHSNRQLAELNNIYQKERPVETRISGFSYAPPAVTRSGENDDANKNRLRLIETNLLQAVVSSPTGENHRALGVFYLTQQKFEDAVRELNKAAELNDKDAKIHNDLGSAYFEAAQYGSKDKSVEDLARANEHFTKATELDPSLLEALFNRSLTLQRLNLPQQAKESWNLYLQKDPSSKWADEARKNLAELEKRQGTAKKKEDILPDFIAAFHRGDRETLWAIHTATKGAFNGASPVDKLTSSYLTARREHNEVHSKEIIEMLQTIGELEKERNADFFFTAMAAVYAKLDEQNIGKFQQAKNAWNEGRKLLYRQQAESSIAQFERSKKLFLALDNLPEALVAELWAAQVLPDVNRIGESRTRLTALIETAAEKNFKVLTPTSYYWIAAGEGRQQKFSRSIKSFQQAVQTASELSAAYEMRHSGQELADAYVRLGEPEKALKYYDDVIDRSGAYPEAAQAYRNLLTFAGVFGKLGLNSTAADFARESVQLNKDTPSLSKTNLVNGSFRELTGALARKGQFEQALKYADESNEIALSGGHSVENNITVAGTYLSRADLKSQMNDCTGALADYDRSLEIYGSVPETTYNLYDVHKGRLLCFQRSGRQDDFAAEFETVRQLSEEYRQNIREDDSRQAFFDTEQIVFDAAVANALLQNDHRKAFEFAEQSKARSLLDFVKSGRSIAEVEQDFSAVAQPLSLDEIQARLPENVQAVQYAVLPDKLAIWTVTKEKFEYSEQPIASAELDKKTSAYLKAVSEKFPAEELRPAAKELYRLLLPKNTDAGKTICLIPDKSLLQVPFASLVSALDKFLIEDFSLFYSPSASILVLASENAKQKEKLTAEFLLSVGNPSFDREEYPALPALPQAEEEVRTIAGHFSEVKTLTGGEATTENFLANIGRADVIHFAGHFIANEENPGYSKLVFADDALTPAELAEKRLPRVKLAVLSACETGFEGYNRSEGVVGMARIFLAAGSPLVLASSWKVDSAAAKDLMIAFHRNRKENGTNSAESLRRAQLELINTPAAAPPYFWAAFNTVGGATNY